VNYGVDDTISQALISIQNDGVDSLVYINGILYATESDAHTSIIQFNRLLAADVLNGADNFQELIYWRKDKTSQRTALEQNIINYYGL